MSDGDSGHQRRLEQLVEWGLGPDVLTDDDVAHAVTLVTDTVAAVVAAGVEPEVRDLAGAAPSLGGSGAATVLATGVGTSPWAAALVNGTAAVRLELDEGNPFCANHPSAHTLPAVLATAQDVDADGPTLLAASAAAYEVAVRVGRGLRLRSAVHPFGTAMVCGAALGVARLRGLDVQQATRAVRLAAALVPASTQRAANQGATVRNAVTGSTAAAGVLAVTLTETGTTDDAFALPTVFGEVLGDGYDDTWLDAGLGSERYLRTGYLKTHACSRWNHAPIEATETLLRQNGFRGQDVVDLRPCHPSRRARPAYRLCGQALDPLQRRCPDPAARQWHRGLHRPRGAGPCGPFADAAGTRRRGPGHDRRGTGDPGCTGEHPPRGRPGARSDRGAPTGRRRPPLPTGGHPGQAPGAPAPRAGRR
jgi:2-methylcitrate dehydratase PrpD